MESISKDDVMDARYYERKHLRESLAQSTKLLELCYTKQMAQLVTPCMSFEAWLVALIAELAASEEKAKGALGTLLNEAIDRGTVEKYGHVG